MGHAFTSLLACTESRQACSASASVMCAGRPAVIGGSVISRQGGGNTRKFQHVCAKIHEPQSENGDIFHGLYNSRDCRISHVTVYGRKSRMERRCLKTAGDMMCECGKYQCELHTLRLIYIHDLSCQQLQAPVGAHWFLARSTNPWQHASMHAR